MFNSDDAFQTAGGGSCDAIVGLKIENEIYVIVFEGFECSSARRAEEDDLYEADFYLEMTGDEWREMIVNISENGSADLGHSLNSLDLNKSPDSLAHSLNEDGYPPRLLLPLQPNLSVLLRRLLPGRDTVLASGARHESLISAPARQHTQAAASLNRQRNPFTVYCDTQKL